MMNEKNFAFENFMIKKVAFKSRLDINELMIEIESEKREKTFLIFNILENTLKIDNIEVTDGSKSILFKKISEYLIEKAQNKLIEESEVRFGNFKKKGIIYSSEINISFFGEKEKDMLFEKIPNTINVSLSDSKSNFFEFVRKIMEELTSQLERIFLRITIDNLEYKYKEIIEKVLLFKFKETKQYKMHCLYDKEFESHFEKY